MADVVLATDQGPQFELDATTLRRIEGDKLQQVALADVVRVRTGRLATMGVVELASRQGTKLLVISDRQARGESATRFRAFVAELHRRLVSAGQPIEYVGGMKLFPILSAVVGAILAGWVLVAPPADAVRRYMMLAVGASSLLVGVSLALKNRKRYYDPLAIPSHLMP